jgi:hypothetical protein
MGVISKTRAFASGARDLACGGTQAGGMLLSRGNQNGGTDVPPFVFSEDVVLLLAVVLTPLQSWTPVIGVALIV